MGKGKRKRKAKAVDPERVLSGAVRLDVRELLRLIHDVNPTERGLPRAAEKSRYTVKSRLQSLLVRDFDDELEVVVDAERDPEQRVVAIHHRYGGGDGCHAILDELDEDVRAALRRRFDELDELDPPEPPAPRPTSSERDEADDRSPSDATTLDALLRAAEAHLEAYAYDEARQAFEAALAAGSGATSAARPLLQLLIELLGMDADALALESRLSRDATKDPDVRGLMALASARSGEIADAKRWLRDVTDEPRRIEVHAALADRALADRALADRALADRALADRALTDGDLAEASAALSAIRDIDPASPHVLRIEGAIAEREQQERAPLEAQLAELDGSPDEARQLAERILARWPNSRVARRTLSELDDRQRAQRLATTIEAADRAERAGELARAIEHLQAAQALCREAARRDAIHQRIASLKEQLERKAEDARIIAVATQLARPDEASLASYLAFGQPSRRAVAELVSDQPVIAMLRWLDAIDPSPGRRAREAVAAVQALIDAQRAMSSGDATTASERLDPHLSTLKKVTEAKRVAEQAASVIEGERRARAEGDLVGARTALERGDLDEAARLLEAIDRKLLPDGDVEPLTRALERARKKAGLRTRYETARVRDDLVAARRAAGELARLDGSEGDTWTSKQDELLEAIRRVWQIETVTLGDDEAPLSPWGGRLLTGDFTPSIQLTGDGELVQVSVTGEWLSLWLYADGGQLTRALGMRLPKPFADIICTLVEGDRVWILSTEARLLGLSLTDGAPVVWESYADFIPEGWQLAGATVTLDGQARYLWLQLEDERHDTQTIVIDRRHRRERHRFTSTYTPYVVPGASREHGELHVVQSDSAVEVTLHDRRAQRARGITTPSRLATQGIGLRPVDGALYFLGHDRQLAWDQDAAPLELVAIEADGKASEPVVFEGSNHELIHCLASSRATDIAFVQWFRRGESTQLAALRLGADGRLDELYDVDLRRGDQLVQDAGARITALANLGGEVELHRLSELPPELPPVSHTDLFTLPRFSGFFCGEMEIEDASNIRACRAQLLASVPIGVEHGLAGYQQAHADDPAALADMILALRSRAEHEHASTMLKQSLERHPDATSLRAIAVVEAAAAEDWDRVAAAHDELDALATCPAIARHLHHVIGIAVFQNGDVASARRVWEQGESHPGRCRLDRYAALAAALQGDAPESFPSTRPEAAAVARLVTAIVDADIHLAAGDHAAALNVLEHPAIRRFGELQSLARAAQAHLAVTPETASDQLAKILTLSAFVEARRRAFHHNLPLPGHTWTEDHLAPLTDRAKAWLDSR